jgi:hypothetical protein
MSRSVSRNPCAGRGSQPAQTGEVAVVNPSAMKCLAQSVAIELRDSSIDRVECPIVRTIRDDT